ncbi:1733_t:CDS:2, partial [Ambispora leptoticha]
AGAVFTGLHDSGDPRPGDSPTCDLHAKLLFLSLNFNAFLATVLMDDNPLIELFEDLADSENDEKKLHALIKRYHTASSRELKDFADELSELPCNSFASYIPTLKTYLSQLLEESSIGGFFCIQNL